MNITTSSSMSEKPGAACGEAPRARSDRRAHRPVGSVPGYCCERRSGLVWNIDGLRKGLEIRWLNERLGGGDCRQAAQEDALVQKGGGGEGPRRARVTPPDPGTFR